MTLVEFNNGGNPPLDSSFSIATLKKQGTFDSNLVVSMSDIENIDGKIKCKLEDGKDTIRAVIASQVAKAHPTLSSNGSRIRVTDAVLNDDGENNHMLMITGLEVVNGSGVEPEPKEVKTPATQTRRPEASIKTPLSAAQPISSLNPYLHCWTIRAKVIGKGPKREFGKNRPNTTGQSNSVFSAELVDEEGTAIEATFWRDAADRFYDTLQEGKVYAFSRGNVKVANKNYNRTRNDYCLHFDSSSTVEETGDQIDAVTMQTRMQFVKVDQLPVFVDKKAPVDVIGVVTEVGLLGASSGRAIRRR
jgi:hypothetical protein